MRRKNIYNTTKRKTELIYLEAFRELVIDMADLSVESEKVDLKKVVEMFEMKVQFLNRADKLGKALGPKIVVANTTLEEIGEEL